MFLQNIRSIPRNLSLRCSKNNAIFKSFVSFLWPFLGHAVSYKVRKVKYSISKRKQIAQVESNGAWMLNCNTCQRSPSRLVSPALCNNTMTSHRGMYYFRQHSTLSSYQFPSILPIISQLVAEQRWRCSLLYETLYALRGPKGVSDNKHSKTFIADENIAFLSELQSDWHMLLFFSGLAKQFNETDYGKMGREEEPNKQLMVPSAVWLNVLFLSLS